MKIETAVIRQFLRERFDDEELDALCFDYFADVQQDFTLGMTKRQKIQLLLDHCRRQNRLPDLLAALERERPDLYKAHFGGEPIVPQTAVLSQPHLRNPHQIFISHANQDVDLAHRLAQDLRDNGWEVWIAPDSIQPGEKWVEAIGRGLEESGVFVLLVTKSAVQSRWVIDETNLAIQLEKQGIMRFLPLLLEQTQMPIMWQAYQFTPFVINYDSGLSQLLSQLWSTQKESVYVGTKTVASAKKSKATSESNYDGIVVSRLLSFLLSAPRTLFIIFFLVIALIIIWAYKIQTNPDVMNNIVATITPKSFMITSLSSPTLTPTSISTSPIHIVQAGDTIGNIAAFYNVSIEDIMVANDLTNVDFLFVGQQLIIPIEDLPVTPEYESIVVITSVKGVGRLESENVQIVNYGNHRANLLNWKLSDEDGHIYTFGQFTLFDGGAGVYVYTRSGDDTITAVYWNLGESIWESGETVTLVDANGAERATFVIP